MRIATVKKDLSKSSQIPEAAADICSTSNVILDSVPPVVLLSKYDLGSFNNLENISTLRSMMTLFETHELTLTEVRANIDLRVIIVKSAIE